MSVALFFVIFLLVLFIGFPIAGCFGLMTVLPNFLQDSFPLDPMTAVRTMSNGLNNFPLLAIPLFVLAGIIMAKGGISEKLFNFFAYFVGNKTAGYPCAVVVTCLFYGAISGSAPATTAAVGSMTIPLLIKLGYDKKFVVALVAVAGGLGVIIPPQHPLRGVWHRFRRFHHRPVHGRRSARSANRLSADGLRLRLLQDPR